VEAQGTVSTVTEIPVKPKKWAIATFFVAGALSIVFAIVRWATQTPGELSQWSVGRGIPLPGWAWNVFLVVLGAALLGFAIWSAVRHHRMRGRR
jgi:hypothetical protein